jgi:hypothetical protein
MSSSDSNIKLAAIEALGAYLEVVEIKECKEFENLIPIMLEAVYSLLLQDEYMGENALTVLEDIAETEPKFYKKNFKIVFETMYRITFEKVLFIFIK